MSTMSVEQIFSSEAIAAAGTAEKIIDMFNEGMASDGNVAAAVRFTFTKGTDGEPLKIDGRLGHILALIQRDDLSGLVEHHVTVQGHQQ
jgi:hypothetical protein